MKVPTTKKIVWIGISIIILVLFGYRLFWYKPAVAVVEVKRQTAQGRIHGPGTVQSKVPVSVSAKITGIVQKLNVDQGDMVKQGDVLAGLDIAELQARLASARFAMAKARQDVEKSRAGVAKSQANLVLARNNYKRDLEVFNAHYISQAAFDITQAQVKVAESEFAETGKILEASQAVLAQATAEVSAAEALLDYTVIRAPMDGLITSRKAEIGDTITPGTPIFNMVDLRTIWVAAWIDQALIASLKEGQSATIGLRSGRKFNGRIARINKEADTVTRELEVDVLFEQLPEPLVIGEEAEVLIAAGEAAGAAVPVTAIVSRDGKTGVLVVEKATTAFREVSLGLQNDKLVLVVKGLSEGELVVIEPGALKPAQKVRPVIQKA
jgi:RND family efflux transporter MFP subunit